MTLLFKKYFSLAIVFNDKLNKIYLKNVNNKLDAFLYETDITQKAPMVLLSQKLVDDHKIIVKPEDWRMVACLNQIDQVVSTNIVTSYVTEDISYLGVDCYDINSLPNNVIPNLKWIVPLCLDMCVIGSSYNQIIIR